VSGPGQIAEAVEQFRGVTVEAWLCCPGDGGTCPETLPFQRLSGAPGDSAGGGRRWRPMSGRDLLAWHQEQRGPPSGRGAPEPRAVLCGRVPHAHAASAAEWVTGFPPARAPRLPPPTPPTPPTPAQPSQPRPLAGYQAGAGGTGGVAGVAGVAGGLVAAGGAAGATEEEEEEEVAGGVRGGAMVEFQRGVLAGAGSASVREALSAGTSIFAGGGGALVTADGHHAVVLHADECVEEGFELAVETAKLSVEAADWLRDPEHPGSARAHSMVVRAVEACVEGSGVDGAGVVTSILHEVEEWGPVCRAVFGVIGGILVASERGRANEHNRARFFERMVNLGRSLLEVRAAFVHREPPQMLPLFHTLRAALGFVQTFDARSGLMRLLKSGSDKAAFEALDRALTQHCTDMSIFLQAAAYQDEHALLREIVQRVGGLAAIQTHPDLAQRVEALAAAQEEGAARDRALAALLQQLVDRLPPRPAAPLPAPVAADSGAAGGDARGGAVAGADADAALQASAAQPPQD
jgi:hypothetical protein